MRILTKNMDRKRTKKSADSLEQIAKSLFVRKFLCSDCISAYRRQIILESLSVGDISDTKVCDLIKIMDRTPTRKANFEFKVVTGDISEDVAKASIINTQQYGFDVDIERASTARSPAVVRPTGPVVHQSFPEETEEEAESSIMEDDEEIEDTSSSAQSFISNPSNLSVIDDVNQLLAEGRERSHLRREMKRENEEYQEPSSATSQQFSVEHPENNDTTVDDEAATPELENQRGMETLCLQAFQNCSMREARR